MPFTGSSSLMCKPCSSHRYRYRLVERGFVQPFLATEVVVERALRRVRALGDGIDARAGQPHCGEFGRCHLRILRLVSSGSYLRLASVRRDCRLPSPRLPMSSCI